MTLDAALRELDAAIAGADREPPGADALRQVLELRRDTLRGRTAGGSEAATAIPSPTSATCGCDCSRRSGGRCASCGRTGRSPAATAVEISQELDLDEARLRKRA